MIFTLGGRHFQTLEEIIQYSQSEGATVNGIPPSPDPATAAHMMQVSLQDGQNGVQSI